MGRLVLVIGGQKSGKSTLAARLAAERARPVVVVAPAEVRDAEFAQRVARHRQDRPAQWRTIESFDLVGALAEAGPTSTVVVDALDSWLLHAVESAGLWTDADVAELDAKDVAATDAILDAVRGLTRAARDRDGDTVVVAGQPGLGPHATGAGARRYVDLHGLALRTLSAAATRTAFTVAGRVLDLGDPVAAPRPSRRPDTTAVVEPAPDDETDDAPTALRRLVPAVAAADAAAAAAARSAFDRLAKPPGGLGELEEVGARLAAIAGRCPPPTPAAPTLVVCAADHGVHADGVSAWPQQVTSSVVDLVTEGRATCNAIARTVGARVAVLDVGTVGLAPADRGALTVDRIAPGTGNLAHEAAMSHEEAARAIASGARLAHRLVSNGADVLVTGDVGIANTTSSACLVAALCDIPPRDAIGPGAGGGTAVRERKRAVVARALARHGEGRDPLDVLASLGGLEHAALVGVILAGAARRVPVVLDGVVADAAALVAVALCPPAAGYLLAGHRSSEPAAGVALDALGLTPLLDLDMGVGEGTGGLLALPLVAAAARCLGEVADIAEVSSRDGL